MYVCLSITSGGNAFMLRMWGIKAAVPVHSLHTAFGIGALLAPQLARPFLGTALNVDVFNSSRNSSEHTNSTSYIADMSKATSFDMTAAIEYPYSIIAVFCLFMAVLFILLFCFAPIRQGAPRNRSKSSAKNAFKPSSWLGGGNKRLGYAVLALAFVIFMLPIGMERAYGKFLFSLGVTGRLQMSPADGTLLESAFWMSFTAGRMLVTLAATRVSQILLILTELSVNVAATAALAAYGQASGPLLAVLSGLFAASLAPLAPTMLSWLNLYIEVTAMLTCMAFFASACGAFVYSWMAGYLFQYKGPDSLLYFMLASSCACAMVFAPLYFSAIKYELGFPRCRDASGGHDERPRKTEGD